MGGFSLVELVSFTISMNAADMLSMCVCLFVRVYVSAPLCASLTFCLAVWIVRCVSAPACTQLCALGSLCVCQCMIKGICECACCFLPIFCLLICIRVMLLRKGLTLEVLSPICWETKRLMERKKEPRGRNCREWQRNKNKLEKGNKTKWHDLDPCDIKLCKLSCIFA